MCYTALTSSLFLRATGDGVLIVELRSGLDNCKRPQTELSVYVRVHQMLLPWIQTTGAGKNQVDILSKGSIAIVSSSLLTSVLCSPVAKGPTNAAGRLKGLSLTALGGFAAVHSPGA